MTDTRAPVLALVGRDRPLALIRELLFSLGADVDVVGPRRSGRSSLADAIAASAAEPHRTAIRVNGVRSLSTTPLGALHAAGFGEHGGQDRRAPSLLQQAIEALTAAVERDNAVFVVDDADLLDHVSTGAIDAARRATGAPLLRTRSRWGGPTESGYIVELGPLSYDELTTAVTRSLGGPMEAATMSRVYALAGGNVGVAIAVVRLAVVEGTLVRRAGLWSAEGELWSPALRGLALDHVAHLTARERSALETIATSAANDETSLHDLERAEALKALAATHVVTTVETRDERRIVLDPPLLAEHFRHADTVAPTPEALFVRLAHEEADAARATATADWNSSPTARTALALARALMAPTGLRGDIGAELDAALAAVSADTTDPLALIEAAELRARAQLARGHDLESASADLHAAVSALGAPFSLAADAAAVLLCVEVGSPPNPAHLQTPNGTAAGLDDDPAVPPAVRTRILRAAQAVAIQRGRFVEAVGIHDRLSSLVAEGAGSVADALHGLALLGCGRSAETRAWAEAGARVARQCLDVDALRLHSLVACLSHLFAGRTDDAADAIATAAALGAPAVPGTAVEAALRGLSAILAARRGDLERAESLRDELAAGPGATTNATSIALEWIDAALSAGRARADHAAAQLRGLTVRLGSSRQEAAAAFALLTALEHSADERALEEARTLLENQQSELFDAQLAQLVARGRHGPGALDALRLRLIAVGLDRLAADGHGGGGFFSAPVALTEREREVIGYVADGLVYREIAARLHLSARTVEGIAARIIRKLGLRDRRELAELANSGSL